MMSSLIWEIKAIDSQIIKVDDFYNNFLIYSVLFQSTTTQNPLAQISLFAMMSLRIYLWVVNSWWMVL